MGMQAVGLPGARDLVALAGTQRRQAAIPASGRHVFRLVGEPSNPADRDAVAVYLGRRQVGYMPSAHSGDWSRLCALFASQRWEPSVYGDVSPGETGRIVRVWVPTLGEIRRWSREGLAAIPWGT